VIRSPAGSSPLVELRQYTLHPGQRDILIELFEREFIESQEDVGMRLIGQFLDLDDPDRFVWLRGFTDMDSRREGLKAFYGGPVWETHRDAANGTMIDSGNVHLLRVARNDATFRISEERPAAGSVGTTGGIVSTTIVYLHSAGAGTAAVEVFESKIAPAIAQAGGSLLGYFLTETSRNDFPGLPVREEERVLVWFTSFGDDALAACAFGSAQLSRKVEHLRLRPTPRSLLTAETLSCSAAEALSDGG
jgi:NIPSNAP